MHARLLVQGTDMLSRTASQRCIRSLDNLSHLPLRQRPTWRVQQLQRCGALPSGTPPLSPWSPIADVRMAPCRAASSDTTPEGLKQQPQRFERLRVKGDGACMFRYATRNLPCFEEAFAHLAYVLECSCRGRSYPG